MEVRGGHRHARESVVLAVTVAVVADGLAEELEAGLVARTLLHAHQQAPVIGRKCERHFARRLAFRRRQRLQRPQFVPARLAFRQRERRRCLHERPQGRREPFAIRDADGRLLVSLQHPHLLSPFLVRARRARFQNLRFAHHVLDRSPQRDARAPLALLLDHEVDLGDTVRHAQGGAGQREVELGLDAVHATEIRALEPRRRRITRRRRLTAAREQRERRDQRGSGSRSAQAARGHQRMRRARCAQHYRHEDVHPVRCPRFYSCTGQRPAGPERARTTSQNEKPGRRARTPRRARRADPRPTGAGARRTPRCRRPRRKATRDVRSAKRSSSSPAWSGLSAWLVTMSCPQLAGWDAT